MCLITFFHKKNRKKSWQNISIQYFWGLICLKIWQLCWLQQPAMPLPTTKPRPCFKIFCYRLSRIERSKRASLTIMFIHQSRVSLVLGTNKRNKNVFSRRLSGKNLIKIWLKVLIMEHKSIRDMKKIKTSKNNKNKKTRQKWINIKKKRKKEKWMREGNWK